MARPCQLHPRTCHPLAFSLNLKLRCDWVLSAAPLASNHNADAATSETWATTTRFRPPALAAYRAVSAWRTKLSQSSNTSLFSGVETHPRLSVTGIEPALVSKGQSAMALRSLSALTARSAG